MGIRNSVPELEEWKKTITNPYVISIIMFLLGGPLTALGTFLIWKLSVSKKSKIIITIVFVVIFNIVQILAFPALIKILMDYR